MHVGDTLTFSTIAPIRTHALLLIGIAAQSALIREQPLADKTTAIATVGVGAIGTSLSRIADIPSDAN